MSSLSKFLRDVAQELTPSGGPKESSLAYELKCPNPDCNGEMFIFMKANGSGKCLAEPLQAIEGYRRYSIWETTALLGYDLYGLYDLFMDPSPIKVPGMGLATPGSSLSGLWVPNGSDPAEDSAKALLYDPWLLDRVMLFASESGIVGENDLVRTLYLVATARQVNNFRLHARLPEQPGAGKSELARFVLSMMPEESVLHLGAGASKTALQYYGDLSRTVIFIDEADSLDEQVRSTLREVTTAGSTSRLVTLGDPSQGFASKAFTTNTKGTVLIEAGANLLPNPADETRVLQLHPDTSQAQTRRILEAQAHKAAAFRPGLDAEIEVWRTAQKVLQPCWVNIPFAPELQELFPADEIRARRDFPRVLALVAAHACLYQCQRSEYSKEGQLFVVAEVEDYRRVYDIAAPLFTQSTKGLTLTQEIVLSELIAKYGLMGFFNGPQAATDLQRKYQTLRGHLEALASRGILEVDKHRQPHTWQVVSDGPTGLTLPNPDEVARAFFSKNPKTAPVHTCVLAGNFMDSDSINIPKTQKHEGLEVKRWTL